MDRIGLTLRGQDCYWITRYVGELQVGGAGNPKNLSGQFKLENFCRCMQDSLGDQPPIRRVTSTGSSSYHIYVEGQLSTLVCMGCKTNECPCEGEDPVFYIKSKNYMLRQDDPPADHSMTEFWLDDLVRTADLVKCPCDPDGGEGTPPRA